MILTAKVAPALAVCVALTTVATLYYQGIGEAPQSFFGGEASFLVAPRGGKLIGTDTVPVGLTGPLRSLESVEAASAEIYVATTVGGRSVMARGVEWPAFAALDDARIVLGRAPQAPHEAVAGAGFARAFDLDVGDPIVLPGSISRSAMRFDVVGIARVEGPADEELLVPLEAARGLAGVPPEGVHLIRVATQDRSQVKALVESVAPTFTYSDVRLSAERFLPGEPVRMSANLTNWGRIDGVKIVQVRQETVSIAERAYRVPAFATVPVELELTIPRTGRFNISVNPTFVVEVGSGNLSFAEAPSVIPVGHRFVVRVNDANGDPAVGANVSATNVSAVADATGSVSLSIGRPGRHLLKAERDALAGEVAVKDVYVVDRGLEAVASGHAVSLSLTAIEFGTLRPIVARVEVENRGGAAGNVSVPLLVNGSVVAFANATLEAGERNWTSVSFAPPPAGNATLRAANGTANVSFRVVPGDDPRIQALLRGYDARAKDPGFSAASGDSADDYIRRTIGNIGAAVIVLSILSGALASLGAVAVLARHIAERRASIGIVKSLGARDAYLTEVVTWEAARYGGLACAMGVVGGLLAALGIDALGVVRAFGHAVHPVLSWTTLGLIFVVGSIVLVVAARLLLRNALAAPPEALLRVSGETAPLPRLEHLIGGRP